MGGKLPLLGVVVFGLIAAVCAAVLMAALRAGPNTGADTEVKTVDVLVASADIPAMTPLTEELLEKKPVAVTDAPKERLGDSVQVIGRVVRAPLKAGQIITLKGLIDEDSGARLASSLPPGLRAVAIELPTSSAMRGLLYPGCRVDVVVSYKSFPGSRSTGPTSKTLLQNVHVLAVEQETVFTTADDKGEEDEKNPTPKFNANQRSLMVTLMVDPQQARELQASRDLGELSLSMRNPHDDSLTEDPFKNEAQTVEIAPEPVEPPEPEIWETVVIRGGSDIETRTFGKKKPGTDETESEQYVTAPTDDEEFVPDE